MCSGGMGIEKISVREGREETRSQNQEKQGLGFLRASSRPSRIKKPILKT
jgi:hypothetical protein